jgi:hypothetical protein
MTGYDLLQKNPHPRKRWFVTDSLEIFAAAGYANIVKAVLAAAEGTQSVKLVGNRTR